MMWSLITDVLRRLEYTKNLSLHLIHYPVIHKLITGTLIFGTTLMHAYIGNLGSVYMKVGGPHVGEVTR